MSRRTEPELSDHRMVITWIAIVITPFAARAPPDEAPPPGTNDRCWRPPSVPTSSRAGPLSSADDPIGAGASRLGRIAPVVARVGRSAYVGSVAKKKDGTAALVGMGLAVGFGALALAAMSGSSTDARSQFLARLRAQLKDHGIGVVAAELGRDARGSVWILTVSLPDQSVTTVQAPVQGGDALALATADDVASRLVEYVGRTFGAGSTFG